MIRFFRRCYSYYVYDLRLFAKLMIFFIVIICIPMILLSLILYTQVDHVLESQLKYSAGQNFNQTSLSVENLMSHYDTLLLSISKSELFYQDLNKGGDSYPLNQQVKDRIAMDKMIYGFVGTNSCTVRVYFPNYFTYFTNGQNYLNYSQVEKEAWYRDFSNRFSKTCAVRMICPPSYLPENVGKSTQVLSIARAITNPENYREYIGLLRLDFNAKDIEGILDRNISYEGSLTYIADGDGRLIASNQNYRSTKFALPDLSKEPSLANREEWSNVFISGKSYFVRVQDIGSYGLNLITVIPREGILRECAHIRNIIFILLAVLCTVAFGFAYWFSLFMNRRISHITKTMDRVKDGELLPIRERAGKDEIGMLIENYNYMIGEMQKLMETTYRSGQEIKNYELKVLQAQINPHFLYNTLDMLNWFAAEKMNSEIQKAVQAIAKFYRISLSNGKMVIPIRDELEHVSAYMQLQNMRYMDGLCYRAEVPEELQNLFILKTTLQPIVENAISHGIMEKPEKKGSIFIRAKRDGDTIVFTVTDDGVGMTPEQLKEVQSGTVKSKQGNGFGIANVNARLKVFYGASYGLFYSSVLGRGTAVGIRIPVVKDEQEPRFPPAGPSIYRPAAH